MTGVFDRRASFLRSAVIDRRYRLRLVDGYRIKRKLRGRRAGEIAQRFLHRFDDEMADGEVVMKPHFALGGMDVDIDAGGIHFEE